MAVSSPFNHYMLLQSKNDLPVKKELILCSQCQSIHDLCYNRCMSLSLSVFIFSGIDTASHNRCRKIGLFTIKSLNRTLLGQPADKNRLQRQRARHYTPQVGPDRVPRPSDQCRLIHEHTIIKYGRIYRWEEHGHARSGSHKVRWNFILWNLVFNATGCDCGLLTMPQCSKCTS